MISPSTLRAMGERTLFISGFGVSAVRPKDESDTGEELPPEDLDPFVSFSTPSGKPAGTFRYPSCQKLYQEGRKHYRERQLGVPPWVLTVDFGLLQQGKKVIWDVSRYCLDEEDGIGASDYMQEKHEVLSLVGPWLTTSTRYDEAMGGGPPYHGHGWTTIDLRTSDKSSAPRKVYATEVLEEQSLLEALQADSYLRETHPELLARAKSAQEILERLGETEAFAFYDFDERTGRVAVRIGFQEEICGMCPNALTQLGFWAKPRPEVLPHLRAARKGQGLLMKAGAISLP